jgi:hypothetical protein
MTVGLLGQPEISGAALGVLIVLGVVELLLQVLALVSLYRAPEVLFGSKWIWVAIIIIGSLLGAILYFLVGRRVPPAATETRPPEASEGSAAAEERAKNTADMLYGQKEEK